LIHLALPYPISANDYWRSRTVKQKGTGRTIAIAYVTDEAKAYKLDVAWRARAAGVRAPILGRVSVSIELYPHRPLDWQTRQRKLGDAWDNDVRCIDLDNARKVLFDALKGIAFEDDRWIWHDPGIRMEPDAHGARVVVRIAPYVRPVPAEQLALLPALAPAPPSQAELAAEF
jgi:crossover junction endodeoxyribonuclease RusA